MRSRPRREEPKRGLHDVGGREATNDVGRDRREQRFLGARQVVTRAPA